MSYNTDTTRYEDFVGFTFADTHSSDLNLFRVNDGGDRYTWDLVPTFQDKTVQVGGRDGTYLFGSDYQKREITINVAFDNVGEEDFRKIQAWGADKKIHKLIFDEWPYKYYNVKLTNPPQLKYICFDESENYSEEAYKGNTTRRRRIYKGEGTFKFTCYESFARGCILSERDQYAREPEYIKVYINKNQEGPIEIPMTALKGIDTAAIYLSSDIYDRGEWGMAYKDNDGNYWRGQWDPNPAYNEGAGRSSTSYYAYQPQKIQLRTIDDEKTVQLVSNYQTYLYPIDLQHGFIGTITKNGTTNGRLVGSNIDAKDFGADSTLLDPLDDFDKQGKTTEIVQYHPNIKVTYGKSSNYWGKEGEIKQEEYGVYRIINYGYKNGQGLNKVEKVKAINKPIAIWENNTLNKIESVSLEEVYDTVFDIANEEYNVDENDPNKKTNLCKFEIDISGWDEQEMQNKLYIVKNASNTLLTDDEHSLYIIPGDNIDFYKLRCEYKDLLGNSHTINLDVELVDENSPKLKNQEGKFEPSITTEYYADTTHSYNEWAPYLGLPKEDPQWENNIYTSINPGDKDMPFIADYEKQDYKGTIEETLSLRNSDKKIHFKIPEILDVDDGIFVDTDLRVIRGYELNDKHKKIPNEHLYNRYIIEGDFFYIPCGEFTIERTTTNEAPKLTYEYRYL